MSDPGDLVVLRQALVRELETINHYQQLMDRAVSVEVKDLMRHLMDEEKEHVAELTALLRQGDAVQDRMFVEGHAEAIGRGKASPLAKPSAPTGSSVPGLTVGSLIGTSFA
jgi:hypothetical protein